MFHAKRWVSRTNILPFVSFLAATVIWGCISTPDVGAIRPATPETEGVVAAAAEVGESPLPIHVTLIQLNDIYEITPVSGGRWGGPARVATVRKRLTEENPNTYTVLAGDLFSPSALGTARVDGEGLAAGKWWLF